MDELKNQLRFSSLTRQQEELLMQLNDLTGEKRRLTQNKLRAIQKSLIKLKK